eukprot:CAMPEP_0170382106 /NCGR_PEP_ID=MMETSP0117_2-20130122/14766_1 /TAXON_ID=400756 /ORGANISM="Durinskia baltica, Strain CSIRO CS-38" /LENGTH=278 /DNA_ID=CAMNT_0010637723 /DNA_START=95 /DNA_END=932 /DNA_ORIENTATION=-
MCLLTQSCRSGAEGLVEVVEVCRSLFANGEPEREPSLDKASEVGDDADEPPIEDDYDPRNPEYIVEAEADEVAERSAALLRQQMAKLEKSIARRAAAEAAAAAEGGRPVTMHYRTVLDEMRGSAAKRGPSLRPQLRPWRSAEAYPRGAARSPREPPQPPPHRAVRLRADAVPMVDAHERRSSSIDSEGSYGNIWEAASSASTCEALTSNGARAAAMERMRCRSWAISDTSDTLPARAIQSIDVDDGVQDLDVNGMSLDNIDDCGDMDNNMHPLAFAPL